MTCYINYINGDREPIEHLDFSALILRFQRSGMTMMKINPGRILVLKDNAIKSITEEKDGKIEEEITSSDYAQEETEERDSEKRAESEVGEEKPVKKKSKQEEADEMLAEMKRLSSCTHPEHDIYYREMSRHNKKTNTDTVIKRYFPVCTTCGVPEKFVKSSGLPDEIKENAKIWDK